MGNAADNTEVINELVELLKKARYLGLTFSIGSAYISRAYIEEQESINTKIAEVIAKIEGGAA